MFENNTGWNTGKWNIAHSFDRTILKGVMWLAWIVLMDDWSALDMFIAVDESKYQRTLNHEPIPWTYDTNNSYDS